MRTKILLIFAVFISCAASAQKEVTVTVIPGDAEIYEIASNGYATKKGVGSILLKLEKEKSVTLEARKPGFVPEKKSFLRDKNGQPAATIELTQRLVQVNASPADAMILVNGAEVGRSSQTITIPKGVSITIDIKKPGFVTQSKTLYNKQGEEVPEITYLFKLEDRVVSVKTEPLDATILVDGKKKGEGATQVIIPKDKCVVVKVEKQSFISNEITYCNKELENPPPLVDVIRLKDRSIQINAMPEDARIFVDGKEVGKGSYSMKLNAGKCSELLVLKSGYVGYKSTLCNQTDATPPEGNYAIQLKEDEAYLQSEQSSIANKNFNLIIENSAISAQEAWKKLVSIIQSYFDEIETVDFSTSYLKTNWVGKTFNVGSDFKSMIRTRVIITYGGEANKYNIKILSEITKPESNCARSANELSGSSKSSSLTATNDECFEPVDRILRKYSDLISEIQRRFK
ncbi:MAG: PEGA domain-containing protein [Bacteroidota bacterium]